MTLDELLLEWSYRTKKGYPSMGNPSDIQILKQILENLDLPTDDILDELESTYANKDGEPGTTGLEPSDDEERLEPSDDEDENGGEEPGTGEKDDDDALSQKLGGSKEYDNVIKAKLGVDIIPTSNHSYKFETNTFDERVEPADLETWQALWEAKPSKKTEPGEETAGVGKGEISLYWLYHYSNSNIKADEGRMDDDPDLYFNGNGVEVKAYDGKSNSVIGLGRFGKDRENIAMLNTIFGISGLAAVVEGNVADKKAISALTWSGHNLEEAFRYVQKFTDIDLEQLADIWPLFEGFKQKIDSLNDALEGWNSPNEGAEKMGRKFLGDKLSRKPGWDKHLCNIEKNGFMRFWYVTEEKLNSYSDLLGKAVLGASQGSIKVHFNKIFG